MSRIKFVENIHASIELFTSVLRLDENKEDRTSNHWKPAFHSNLVVSEIQDIIKNATIYCEHM